MKKNNSHPFFLFLLIFLSVVGVNNPFAETQHNIISLKDKLIILKHWQIAKDNTPKNIFQNSNDIVWKQFNPSLQENEYSEGNWLLKAEIVIEDSLSTKNIFGLFPINFITAYEIYWDGIKVAQNGIIGINNTDEKAGSYNYNTSLPANLVTSGKHTVILRISNYHSSSSWKWYYGGILIGPYEDVLKNMFISKYQAFFIMGILFIPFLFNLFLFVARKRKTEHLLFSLICFIVILDAATNLVPTF
ncbi:MAG: hypothetical protein Q8S39_09675, partial [Ignavibacteria bacterium]|nr:hypothetical protein [Ignavibacteria bacterium]